MSTAKNHMRRSHRSERGHMYAGMNRYKVAVQNQIGMNYAGGFFGKLFRKARQKKEKDVAV